MATQTKAMSDQVIAMIEQTKSITEKANAVTEEQAKTTTEQAKTVVERLKQKSHSHVKILEAISKVRLSSKTLYFPSTPITTCYFFFFVY